ncbi:ASCH domain-containing protein [Azospirillum sp. TSO5]|uniref:ASCH domain-containing protein n=1 Tax=Azospirillum sp. TSO5 TaxID=716760 RepID=UPI000D642FD7|nr:ASCH domain-containing protein [Azospirillum sp. TSO5]
MKGLIIREPWIDLILSGRKTWEMRTRPTSVRGLIALIRKGSGVVCGVADLVGSHPPLDADGLAATQARHCIPPTKFEEVIAAGWLAPWELARARCLTGPVPYRHPSGAVTWVDLSPEVTALIERQVGDEPVPRTVAATTRAQAASPPPTHHGDGHVVRLTEGAIRNGYIRLTNALRLFPDDAIGGSSKDALAPGTVTVEFDPGPTIVTDIAGDKMIFRDRGGTRAFFTAAGAMPGDQVHLQRVAPRHIRIRILKDTE